MVELGAGKSHLRKTMGANSIQKSTISHLNVSSIIVNSTNFPSNGTTSDVGGMISANKRKNTVNDKRMDMLSDTCNEREMCVVKLLIYSSALRGFPRARKIQFSHSWSHAHEDDKSRSKRLGGSKVQETFLHLLLAAKKLFALIKKMFSS